MSIYADHQQNAQQHSLFLGGHGEIQHTETDPCQKEDVTSRKTSVIFFVSSRVCLIEKILV
jgi:hypothetical protein